MSTLTRTAALALAAAALSAGAPAMAQGHGEASAIAGVWKNPKNTVHVEIRPCGVGVCGQVVWASAKAQADAMKGSGKPLVGSQLFRDLRDNGQGVWKGKVYVPDYNKVFSGSAQTVGSTSLKATGCLFAGIICKSQTWSRIENGKI